MQYHVVANETLYSDAYHPHIDDAAGEEGHHHGRKPGHDLRPVHLDLPTLLEGKSLSVDVASFYGWRNIRVNGYNDVLVRDGVARDGVLHVPARIIVPPKKGGEEEGEMGVSDVETVEEFVARFEGEGEGQREKGKGWWEGFEL